RGQNEKSILDPYRDYLIRRWSEGCQNAAALYREITELGYTGSQTLVKDFVATLRRRSHVERKRQTEHTFTRHAPFCSCDGMCRLSQVSLRPASAESGRRQARTRTTASANPGRPVHPGQGWASAQADT